MKNKNRPAVPRDEVQSDLSKKNVLIIDTVDGVIEIDLSDDPGPDLSEISEDEIPDPKDDYRFLTQSHGHELIDTWINGYPNDLDEQSFISHHGILQCHHLAVFDELVSSNLLESLQSLSYFVNSFPAAKGIVEVFLLEKLIEERKEITLFESVGFPRFSVENSQALQRIELLIEVLKPNLKFENFNEEEYLLWGYEFSDFCEILSLLCDAKSFRGKDPIKVFRIFKKFIRFKTSATDGSFTSTSCNNRKRKTDPLYFYHLLEGKYYEAEKVREEAYGERDTKRSRGSK